MRKDTKPVPLRRSLWQKCGANTRQGQRAWWGGDPTEVYEDKPWILRVIQGGQLVGSVSARCSQRWWRNRLPRQTTHSERLSFKTAAATDAFVQQPSDTRARPPSMWAATWCGSRSESIHKVNRTRQICTGLGPACHPGWPHKGFLMNSAHVHGQNMCDPTKILCITLKINNDRRIQWVQPITQDNASSGYSMQHWSTDPRVPIDQRQIPTYQHKYIRTNKISVGQVSKQGYYCNGVCPERSPPRQWVQPVLLVPVR